MKLLQAIIGIAAFVVVGALSHADPVPGPTIHYAPAENLEHIDVELITDTQAAAKFKLAFEVRFDSGSSLSLAESK